MSIIKQKFYENNGCCLSSQTRLLLDLLNTTKESDIENKNDLEDLIKKEYIFSIKGYNIISPFGIEYLKFINAI